ncbi:YitT family protein [Niallia sp. Krafla_26]|uniref:YitT family protein n=1 Tax=Niallia sp. Krafla_26 TaxID=3064703 RepID=UPI003D1671EA
MKTIETYFFLLCGAILQGLSMSLFLFPHSIPSGGGAGLAILMNHFLHLPLGFALWIANAVFLIFALNYFGFTWTFRTLLSVAVTSTTVSIITPLIPHFHFHILVELFIGGIGFGLGVGILIRKGASSGGMVIPALMISSYRNWRPGKVMMVINLIIFLITSIVIDYKIVAYAIICQLVSTNMIDLIHRFKFHKYKFLSPSWRKR